MAVNRREFVAQVLTAAALSPIFPSSSAWSENPSEAHSTAKTGSGSYFGDWIEDEFGLPAFRYTCDQTKDAKAITRVSPGLLSPTEHIHQVGNDRLVAIASNYGHVRVRQDEGAPKFLNDYAPEHACFGGGIGYLAEEQGVLTTFYPGNAKQFERLFGVGYFRKKVTGEASTIDQIVFAPFGNDPVLVSQSTISNSGPAEAAFRWVEYWNCQPYQFSFRSFIEASASKRMLELRRDLGARFAHRFRSIDNGSGLLESKEFLGREEAEEHQFQSQIAYLEKNPNLFLSPPAKNAPREAGFDDLNPPPTFLVSLDAPPDHMTTHGKDFFGEGGASRPTGLMRELDGDLGRSGRDSALLIERKFSLRPGESRTLTFLYGYLVSGIDLDSLITKYRQTATHAFEQSCHEWKQRGLRLSTPDEPWVEREVAWNHYYLRSGLTYDDFFHQHVISQGSIYQYVMGFQGAARDPLQHVLPFIFSDPDLVKEILRYTLKEVRPDGSLPYGIVGHGMPMPTTFDNSSDLPLWLLWVASEYLLATRDLRFLDSDVVTVYGVNPGRDSVRNLLARCYRHLVEQVKTGEHGLMRMLQDDWNDALVTTWVEQNSVKECVEKGESVLNSAMAAYVFDHYARALVYAGDDGRLASEIRRKAEEHRQAVRGQWTGKWFRRAWLGPTRGWLGEKGLWLEPQPWTIIGGSASEEQIRLLVESMNQELRRVSPIGAVQLNKSPDQEVHGVWPAEPGTSVNGGVWPSLNQTLIWALARVDGAMAWEEWKKNSFARHAEVYPEIWYGTWSGPDVLNSAASQRPGEATSASPTGWTWADFPVLNMHTHACPLYSAAKLLGLEFTEAGVTLAPKIPLSAFRFDSPLLGLVKGPRGYEGWYNPMAENNWSIRLVPVGEEAKHWSHVEVNGNRIHPRLVDGALEIRGVGGAGHPLRWAVSRG